eukprot:GHVS01042262.1.p1 GENE.GHVS01042262.1~~GHVS01042262.1.p1  ORF type:complete len:437 (-),score=66.40 GHVS01042262.1:1034-2344(-)
MPPSSSPACLSLYEEVDKASTCASKSTELGSSPGMNSEGGKEEDVGPPCCSPSNEFYSPATSPRSSCTKEEEEEEDDSLIVVGHETRTESKQELDAVNTSTTVTNCRLAPQCAISMSTTTQTIVSEDLNAERVCERTVVYLPEYLLQFQPPPEAVRQVVVSGGGGNGGVVQKTIGLTREDRKNKGMRKIFGTLSLEPYEVEAVEELKTHLDEQKVHVSGTIFDDDRAKLRFLQGNEWDNERCANDITRHLRWRETNLPVQRKVVQDLLKLGYFYIHGRDRCMRPVLYIRCKQLNTAEQEGAMKVIVYLLELLISTLLVENRVEQWRVVIDMAECAIYNMPVVVLRDVTVTLSRNYRGRLHQMAIINAPLVFWGLWQIVNVALSETTRSKISIHSGHYQAELLKNINENQLEKKYGGCQEDVTLSEVLPVMPGPPIL